VIKNKNYVKKRIVFYLSGYDPRGAKYYYHFYKTEANKEKNIQVSPKKRYHKHISTWTITNQNDTHYTESEYHFLEWDDIIRKQWKKTAIALIKDWFFYMRVYIFGGLFLKYFKKSPKQMEGIFFPFNYIWISFIIIFLSTTIVWSYALATFPLSLAIFTSLVFVLLSIYALLYWGTKVGLFWLLRIFVFSAKYILEGIPSLEKRTQYFAKHLADTLSTAKAKGIDEVLFVSHSLGTSISIPLLSKCFQLLKDKEDIPMLSILSLGQCVPLVSVVPFSEAYQKEMLYLSRQDNLIWVDYTAQIDLACFPQLNFFEDVGIECRTKENFHFLSPRFHLLYSPQNYAKIRKNLSLSHFLYMMSSENKEGYNFFTLTSGRNTLKWQVEEWTK
jgi:hypothetical protein